MTKNRMGSLGKLSDFGKVSQPLESVPEQLLSSSIQESQDVQEHFSASLPETDTVQKPVTINIKISREQHVWLTDTARQVRENNVEPVIPSDRMFPQHLIGVAIELLRNSDINWSEVKKPDDLKNKLKV